MSALSGGPDRTDARRSPSTADLVLSGVDKRFVQGDRVVEALNGCSLHVASGEFFTLVGPSGTGKTTLLGLVAGFDMPDAGSVTVGGASVARPGPDRAVVFQSPTLFPWQTALDNVAQGLRSRKLGRSERRRLAASQLAEVGLVDASGRHPHQMSGGMQQRVGIARALVMEPTVLLMDEPFAALDAYVRQEAQDLIVTLWSRRRITTLFVTHSIEEALLLSTRVGVMAGGQVAEIVDVPFEHPRDPTAAAFNDLRRYIHDRIEAGVKAERSSAVHAPTGSGATR